MTAPVEPGSHDTPNYVARGRRREATRDKILKASADQFYRRGIRAVSVQEAADASGVTKPTMYAHFPTKDALVAACLDAVDTRHFDWFVQSTAKHSANGQAPALALYDVLNDWFQGAAFRGCAFINASLEVGGENPPAQVAVLRHKDRTRVWLEELVTASGVVDGRRSTLAAQLMLLMEGAIVTAMVEQDHQAAERAKEAAAALLTLALA